MSNTEGLVGVGLVSSREVNVEKDLVRNVFGKRWRAKRTCLLILNGVRLCRIGV